ncbi:MAG TPA: hypothetical protein VGL72_31930 [Bryobacteraceae bacterium]
MRWEISILIAAAAVAAGQAPNGLGIGETMKRNADVLRHYSYKRRTEITIKGQTRGARTDLVRYVDGKMETVSLGAPGGPDPSTRRRGLRGKIAESKIEQKKEEMKAERERLEELLHSYLSPGSDAMRALLAKAAVSRIGPGPDADVKVVATGLKNPTDSLSLVWSVASHRPVSIELQSQLDGKPVRLVLEYASLKDGAFYAARTLISMPKKDTVIRIDRFDYSMSGEAR